MVHYTSNRQSTATPFNTNIENILYSEGQAGKARQSEGERGTQGDTVEAYFNTPQAAKREATAEEEGIKKSIWHTTQATDRAQ